MCFGRFRRFSDFVWPPPLFPPYGHQPNFLIFPLIFLSVPNILIIKHIHIFYIFPTLSCSSEICRTSHGNGSVQRMRIDCHHPAPNIDYITPTVTLHMDSIMARYWTPFESAIPIECEFVFRGIISHIFDPPKVKLLLNSNWWVINYINLKIIYHITEHYYNCPIRTGELSIK